MANKVHVKKGDKVLVLSGKDKGKKGKVLQVVPDDMKVLVEGINMVTKHVKPKSRYQQGGIINQEAPVSSSKVMFLCDKCGKPSKIGKKILENGEKVRFCKKCDEIIEIIKEAKSDN